MSLFDQLLAPLERLINEHGSAALMKERLDLIKAQLAEAEARHAKLEAEHVKCQAALKNAEHRAGILERELRQLKSGQHSGFCCDACGSPNVKRTGSRPDPTFGQLGIKEGLFTCADCGAVSAFTMDPPK